MRKSYTIIKLPISQQKVEIFEITPPDLWRANNDMNLPQNKDWKDCGSLPFLACRCILVEEKQINVQQLAELPIDDWLLIGQAFDSMFIKTKF